MLPMIFWKLWWALGYIILAYVVFAIIYVFWGDRHDE